MFVLVAFVAEKSPQRFRRRIQAAMVAHLVDVDVGKQLLPRGIAQSERPVLNLRVAGKQELPLADFEQQNHAGIVHHAIQVANQL